MGRIREERLKELEQRRQQASSKNEEELEEQRIRRIKEEFERRRSQELEEKRKRERELQRLLRQQQAEQQQKDLDRASLIPRTESPRAIPQSLPDTESDERLKNCYMPQQIEQGNVTCNGKLVFGEYEVASGDTCQLYCRPGFVSLELKQTRCLSGRWSRRLACVRPDAMLIIGGRSNTQGVLNTVELV